MMMNDARIEVLETAVKLKDEEIARLKKALDSWMSKGQDDQAEIYALKNELAAVRTWFHKLCPRGAESSEMMKLERILGDVGVEKEGEKQ